METLRDWFWLYRPGAPSARAQSVQVLNAAHAMAARGHRVELCVESDRPAVEVLGYYGLAPVPSLRVRALPRGTLGSVAYRAAFARWVVRTGGEGIAFARRKKHAAWALSWLGGRFKLVLEVHEVDSAQAIDRGEDGQPWWALEERVLRGAWGVVANAEGTLELLRERHSTLPPALVAHNAARPGVPPRADASGVGVVGSVRAYKDVDTVVAAAALVEPAITWIGADTPLPAPVRSEPPIPPRDVPGRLAGFSALIVPLSPGRFGDALTSPLKLWDALASGVPVIAADTRAVRRVAEGAYVPYAPGDGASLAAAIRETADPATRARVVAAARVRARSWDQRAAEIAAFVDAVAG